MLRGLALHLLTNKYIIISARTAENILLGVLECRRLERRRRQQSKMDTVQARA